MSRFIPNLLFIHKPEQYKDIINDLLQLDNNNKYSYEELLKITDLEERKEICEKIYNFFKKEIIKKKITSVTIY